MNKEIFNFLVSSILTFATYYLGGVDLALTSLLTVMIIDYLTGILSAIYNKELSSKIGLKGIIKKIGYLCGVALAVLVDKMTINNGIIRNLIIYALFSNDGLSILENLGELNIKLPKIIKERLLQIKDKGSDKNGE